MIFVMRYPTHGYSHEKHLPLISYTEPTHHQVEYKSEILTQGQSFLPEEWSTVRS
jgi:hypothetical protein